MAAKNFFVACASLVLVSTVAACPCGSSSTISYGGRGMGLGAGIPSLVAASNGGGLPVAVSSPTAPTGLSLVSENFIEGFLEVTGTMPLLAAVAFEGTVPSSGAAGAVYRCGNGNVGISADSLAAAGLASGSFGVNGANHGYGLGSNAANLAGAYGLGNNVANIAGAGCGCGRGVY